MAEYIDREDAINAISIVHGELIGIGEVVDILDEMPATDVQPVKWIPVTERLPEDQVNVLCSYHGNALIGWYMDGDGWHDDHIYRFYPSHWMPLPEPPKDGET